MYIKKAAPVVPRSLTVVARMPIRGKPLTWLEPTRITLCFIRATTH